MRLATFHFIILQIQIRRLLLKIILHYLALICYQKVPHARTAICSGLLVGRKNLEKKLETAWKNDCLIWLWEETRRLECYWTSSGRVFKENSNIRGRGWKSFQPTQTGTLSTKRTAGTQCLEKVLFLRYNAQRLYPELPIWKSDLEGEPEEISMYVNLFDEQ